MNSDKDYRIPDLDKLCEWADTLDWKNDDTQFLLLAKKVVESLDTELRERYGRHFDQFGTWEEALRIMRRGAARKKDRHAFMPIFMHLRFYVYYGMISKKKAG